MDYFLIFNIVETPLKLNIAATSRSNVVAMCPCHMAILSLMHIADMGQGIYVTWLGRPLQCSRYVWVFANISAQTQTVCVAFSLFQQCCSCSFLKHIWLEARGSPVAFASYMSHARHILCGPCMVLWRSRRGAPRHPWPHEGFYFLLYFSGLTSIRSRGKRSSSDLSEVPASSKSRLYRLRNLLALNSYTQVYILPHSITF